MGTSFDVICKTCKHHFNVSEGGGMHFELIRCDRCGKTKSISKEKGSTLSYLLKEEDTKQVLIKHQCKLKGKFTSDAPARCPKCYSTEYKRIISSMIFYDLCEVYYSL